jgi:D-alanine-D-alanine ligase
MLSSKHIAVLMGGPGSEREVSLASGRAVLKALQGLGLNASGVDVTGTVIDLPDGTDLAFNVIHGTFGEDGQLQRILEEMGVPYTGAGVQSSRRAFDKGLAKEAFVKAGVPTPASELIDAITGEPPEMELPYVVKSPCQGSSVGVYICKNQQDAISALEDVVRYGSEALIEQYVQGRELTVAIIGQQAYPIVEIIAPGGIYDMASKYPWLSGAKGSQYVCPADLDAETTRIVQEAALAAHRALGIEIYSRVDVLLDAQNRPYVLEANTIPGMTETSLLPKAAAAAGIDFPALCLTIAGQSYQLRRA